jgi:hypothetical protein
MKTTVLNRADVEGKNNKQIADKINGKENDTQKGATVAENVLKAEPRTGETKSIADVMDAIRSKAKLVTDLQSTIDRRTQLQQLYSEGKLKIAVQKGEYGRDELTFQNENIVDFIVKSLVEKSKEVESDITAQLIALEK